MASSPARVCNRPGCRGLVRGGVCSECGPRPQRVERRANAQQRGYTSVWNRLAQTHKACNPLCQVCEAEGRTTIATISHHVTAVASGGAVLVGQDELVSVCSPCHQRIEGLGGEWRTVIRPQTNPTG
jgi:5-methylcytosine-specific restriction protein A